MLRASNEHAVSLPAPNLKQKKRFGRHPPGTLFRMDSSTRGSPYHALFPLMRIVCHDLVLDAAFPGHCLTLPCASPRSGGGEERVGAGQFSAPVQSGQLCQHRYQGRKRYGNAKACYKHRGIHRSGSREAIEVFGVLSKSLKSSITKLADT